MQIIKGNICLLRNEQILPFGLQISCSDVVLTLPNNLMPGKRDHSDYHVIIFIDVPILNFKIDDTMLYVCRPTQKGPLFHFNSLKMRISISEKC